MNKSQRSEVIARASLHVYPPHDAFDEYDYHGLFEYSWKVGDITINAHESRKGESTVLTAYFKPKDKCFRIHATEWSRRIPHGQSKESWAYNFALVCLEATATQDWYRKMMRLKKLLTAKQLPRRMCWSKAVTDMIIDYRADAHDKRWKRGDSGLICEDSSYNRCEIRHLDRALLNKMSQLAKDFTPSTEPVTLSTTSTSEFQTMMADSTGQCFALSDVNLQPDYYNF